MNVIIHFPFTLHGQPVTLLASCLGDGDTGGGLLYFGGEQWTCIDDVCTTGLYVAGDQLIRVLWAPSQVSLGTSILHYTSDGSARAIYVDGLTDPHDVLWDGHGYLAVSSLKDAIFWIDADGSIVKTYQPAKGEDCWHLNCLLLHQGVLYATAFGRFEEPRGWVGERRRDSGVLFRLDTEEDVISTLTCPHTPRIDSDEWILCESLDSRLSAFDRNGRRLRSVGLQDWTRGLTYTDDYILVGESVNRQLSEESRCAMVAVLDRKTWAVRGRLKLPFREVYDLVLVSPEVLDGILNAPHPRLFAACPPRLAAPDVQACEDARRNSATDEQHMDSQLTAGAPDRSDPSHRAGCEEAERDRENLRRD